MQRHTHIARLLFSALLVLILVGSVKAQPSYNSHAARSEREASKRQQEREQYQERKSERQRRSNAMSNTGGGTGIMVPAKPAETPQQIAERTAATRRRNAAVERQNRTDAARKSAKAAADRNDVEGLVAIMNSADFKNLCEDDPLAWMNIRWPYVERLNALTRDSLQYFDHLRILFSETKDERDIPKGFFARDIDEMDFVSLRLMVLMGNYSGAIGCLRTSSYYGVKQFVWTKNDEDLYPAGAAKAKEAYHFINYMAGRCFRVLNMADSAARYTKLGGDRSAEWNRLAVYQGSVGWSTKQPMLTANELEKISGKGTRGN